MTTFTIVVFAVTLPALLQTAHTAGSLLPKKVQIHVPHTIQHHHHTHTKYHFITVGRNATAPTSTTAQPPVLIMPMMPGLMMNGSVVSPSPNFPQGLPLPQLPNQGQQPNVFQQPQPVQPNALPQQPMQPPQPPVLPLPNPNIQGLPAFLQYTANHRNGDYDYADNIGRFSRNKIVRADPPTHSMPPLKFKTIINVQETKKIPLSELLDFSKLLQREPPRRIKIDVFPEQSIKQTQKVMDELQTLQDNLRSGAYKTYEDDLEYDRDTEAFQSRQETVTEKPEWVAVQKLLEKHIQEDFPGLKIKAELKHIPSNNHTPAANRILKERADRQPVTANNSSIPADLKHIGYIVIGENNEQFFVGVDETSPT